MRKILSNDIDIWNLRLKKSNLKLNLSNKLSYGDENPLSIASGMDSFGYKILDSIPNVDFYFSYSISESAIVRFDSILLEKLTNGIKFNLRINKESNSGFYRDKDILLKMKENHFDIVLSNNEHMRMDRKYIQRIFNFKSVNLLELIFYITSVEDTIKVLDKYFDYGSGSEIIKSKYKPGEIVSHKSSVSDEFFVHSLVFEKEVGYYLMKVEENFNDAMIFSDPFISSESEILPNRNSRIDILLN